MNISKFISSESVYVVDGVYVYTNAFEECEKAKQTSVVFGDKWKTFSEKEDSDQEPYDDFQQKWFLELYGFDSENDLRAFLSDKKIIMDAGAGLGKKAAWIAGLAPHALVIAMDYSDSILQGPRFASHLKNIVFFKGDIANTGFFPESIDCVICDQVIMHTSNPQRTLCEFSRIASQAGEILCYWYKKKALPRELLDDYFRKETLKKSSEEIWELAEQLTNLGRSLAELNVTLKVPAIPALDIKEGEYDLQRFIYWNFLKCFWNPEFGFEASKTINFDWYSPSNAKRFSLQELQDDLKAADLHTITFHEEEACYSGRFRKTD